MRGLILAALLLVTTSAFASSRVEKIQTLVNLWGLQEIFDQQKVAVQAQLETAVSSNIGDSLKSFELNAEYQERIRKIISNYVEAVTKSGMSGDEYVSEFMNQFGPAFTDEELDQLIVFYSSPLGKKEVTASKSAVPKVVQTMVLKSTEKLQNSMQNFTRELQATLIECKCHRKGP